MKTSSESRQVSRHQRRIPVFFSVNDGFVRAFLVACHTLLTHSTRVKDVTILYTDLSRRHRDILRRCVEAHERRCHFIRFDQRQILRLPAVEHLASECYYRLLISEYTDADVAAYFDCDLVVLRNADELLARADDLGDSYGAAARDVKASETHRRAICRDPTAYHNSGVMLYNLRQLRAIGAKQQILNLIATDFVQRIVWADQDILNHLFEGHWHTLPERYNCIQPKHYDANTVVLHFAGRRKPWHRDYRATPDLSGLYRDAAGPYRFLETRPEFLRRRAAEKWDGLRNRMAEWRDAWSATTQQC